MNAIGTLETPRISEPNSKAEKQAEAGSGTFPLRNFLVIGTAAILAEMLVIGLHYATEQNPPAELVPQSALLFVLTAGALGIERAMELGWTIMGLVNGPWVPPVPVSRNFNRVLDQVDSFMNPFIENARSALSAADKSTRDQWKRIQDAENQLGELQAQLKSLRNGGMDSNRLSVYVDAIKGNLEKVRPVLEGLGVISEIGSSAVGLLDDVVASFDQQPGRRLICLYTGMFLGLIMAALLNLNIFLVPADGAAQGTTPAYNPVAWAIAIVFTGLVLGLGSNPTHDVIRLVQETKSKAQRSKI